MNKKKLVEDVLEMQSLGLDIESYKEEEVEYIIEFLENIYKNYNKINNTKLDDLNLESIKQIDINSEKEDGKTDT
jgi:hypothetical protein